MMMIVKNVLYSWHTSIVGCVGIILTKMVLWLFGVKRDQLLTDKSIDIHWTKYNLTKLYDRSAYNWQGVVCRGPVM